MTTYRIAEGGKLIAHSEVTRVPEGTEVRIAIRAASLNYRDLLVLGDSASIGRIPLSDGAGVIEAIGRDVTNLKVLVIG